MVGAGRGGDVLRRLGNTATRRHPCRPRVIHFQGKGAHPIREGPNVASPGVTSAQPTSFFISVSSSATVHRSALSIVSVIVQPWKRRTCPPWTKNTFPWAGQPSVAR